MLRVGCERFTKLISQKIVPFFYAFVFLLDNNYILLDISIMEVATYIHTYKIEMTIYTARSYVLTIYFYQVPYYKYKQIIIISNTYAKKQLYKF